MPDEDRSIDLSEFGFEDAESLKAALAEATKLREQARERDVADLCQKWQEEGKAPALVAEAQAIMMSDDGATLNLSEDGKEVSSNLTDIVKRLVDKAPAVKLDQEQVSEEQASEEGVIDEEEETALSADEKRLASQIFFDEGLPMKEAVIEAKKRVAEASGVKA